MELLREMVITDGKVYDNNVLKVDSFLNHQIDAGLMMKMAESFYEYFKKEKITKILTIEASGIAPAIMVANLFKVPMVFAKKSKPSTLKNNDVYTAEVHSYTKNITNTIVVSEKFINKDDKFKFFAKTQPKAVSATVERQYVKFSFQQDGKYPIIPDNYYQDPTRYCLIVEFMEVNTDNYYEIELINHNKSDLQLNNIFYDYERKSDVAVAHALTETDETKKRDLYFQFKTQQKLTNQPSPVNEGLYSAHIYNRRLQRASKVRVELRIKREGLYKASTLSSPSLFTTEAITLKRSPKNGTINSVHELGLKTEINKPMELRRGDPSDISMPVDVIIGENITKVKGFNTESMTTISPVLVNDNDPVYRVGYVVAIKAREYKFKDGIITKGQFKRFIVPLTEVVKDVHSYMDGVSDRLIFETPLYEEGQEVVDYNDFEVQVYWENPELSDSSVTKQEQMGALKEITVSFASDFE